MAATRPLKVSPIGSKLFFFDYLIHAAMTAPAAVFATSLAHSGIDFIFMAKTTSTNVATVRIIIIIVWIFLSSASRSWRA